MKNVSISILIAFASFALLFSSCASLQKGEFAQRKYYNFPRAKHTADHIASTREVKNNTSITPVILQEKTVEPVILASAKAKKAILPPAITKKSSNKTSPTSNKNINNISIETPKISFKKSEIRKQALDYKNQFPANNDAGLMFFIAIVAAIFIPPIGIYIKENWRITKWFWVTLVLCILAGGLLGIGNPGFGIGFGILWLIAAVIALMVVFDMI